MDENVENAYGAIYGPIVKLSEILPRVWDELTYDEQTVIMAETLGAR